MVSIARQRVSRRRLHALVMSAGTAVAFYSAAASPSLPQNPNAVEGTITTTLTPGLANTPNQTLTVNTFKNSTIINWQSFNIANGNTVQFNQPGAASRVLNRISSTAPSQIHGNLFSNGQVFLVNPAGVIFGPSAVVNTGGLLAAAGTITNQNFLDGNYQFTNLVGGVENHGSIHAPVVALVGRYVTQAGIITGAENGVGGSGSQFGPADVVILAAGENVLIGEAFGSVFVSAPADLGLGGDSEGGSPTGAGDVFSIAAWHASGGNTSANTVRIASRGIANLGGTINASQLLEVNALNDLSVNGTVIAGNALLRSELGGISGPGVIASPTLALEAQGGISLDGANGNGNQVGSLEASSVAGGVLFVNEGDLTVNSLSTGPGQAAEVRSNTGSLNMAGAVNAGSLTLRSTEGAVVGEGLLTAAQLEVLAALGVQLRGDVGTLSGEAGSTSATLLGGEHDFVFLSESGTVNINGVSATLDVRITSFGGISIVGGTINAGRNIVLASSGAGIQALGGGMIAGVEIDLDSGAGINATQPLVAPHAQFAAIDGINVTNMSLGSVNAFSESGGNITLFNNGSLLVNGVSTTGNVSITSTGEMTIALQVSGDVITLQTTVVPAGGAGGGPSIVIESRVEAQSELTMSAVGDIRTQNGGTVQAGTESQAGSISADAGGNVDLDIDVPGAGAEFSGDVVGSLNLVLSGESQFTMNEVNVGGGITVSAAPAADAGGLDLVFNNLSSGLSVVISASGTITVNGNLQAGADELISLSGQKGIILNPGSLLDFAGGGIDRRVLLDSIAGSITQSGGAGISAGQLQALGTLVSLLGSNNQVSRFAASANNGVELSNSGALEIGTTSFGGGTTSGIFVLSGEINVNNGGSVTVNDAVFSVLGNTAITATNGGVQVNSDVAANGSTTVSGQNGVDVAAGANVLGANVLIASSDGNISIAGFVDGNNQAIVDANGSVLIDLGGVVRGETVGVLAELGNIDIAGDVQSNNLAYLRSRSGGIATSGNGLISAQQLQVLAQLSIDVNATGVGGSALTLAGRSQAGDLSVNSLSELVVGQVGSPLETTDGLRAFAGDVNLRSLTLGNAGISVLQTIRASDTIRLDTRGTLTSGAAGRLVAPNLIIGGGVGSDDERPTLVDLLNITGGGQTNQVAVLDVQARGEVLFRNDGSLLIQRIATNDFVLVLNDGTVQVVEISTEANGDVAIVAENGDIELLGGAGTSGIVAAGQTVVLDARSNGARVFDAGTGEAFGTITTAQLKVLADSGIFLEADHSVGTLAASNRTGDIRFFNTGTLTIGEIGAVAGVPSDAPLAGVTTLEALASDLIRIESGTGNLLIDRDVISNPSVAILPPENRFVELRADNGMIFGLGRIIAPRLEAFARNGIDLQGDNQVGTLLAEVTGGFGPFPPMAPNGIVFYNISDLIVESALAPNAIQISAEGNLRFQRAVAGGALAGHAGGDLIVEDRGAFAETLRSGSWMSLYALNDVLIERGGRIDSGSWLTLNAQRDILQSVGGGVLGSEVIASGNIRYDAVRAIQLNSFSTVNSTSGTLAQFLAGGELDGLGITLGDSSSIVMGNANGGVLLSAASSGVGQSNSSEIIASSIEALAANSVALLGANQASTLAGEAGNGDFFYNNVGASLLTIGTLNLDGLGSDSVGVVASQNAQINASGGSIEVVDRVVAGNDALLNAQGSIDVIAGALVQSGNNATLFAQQDIGIAGTVFAGGDALLDAGNDLDLLAGGLVDSTGFSTLNAGNTIDVAGILSADAGSTMFAGAGIDISGSVFGGSTTGTSLAGPINISGIIDVNGNAIMSALAGPIVVTDSGQVVATGDAALTAAEGIDMAGTINAALAELNAGEAITATGSITADQLLALAQLGISLTGGNVVANFAANSATGSIFFNNNGGLVITSVARAGGGSANGVRATSGTVTIVNANGTVTVEQVAGASIQAILADLRITGGQLVGGGVINAQQLRVLASQGISLTGNNIVGTLAAGSNGSILFNNAGNLIIGDVTGTNGITTSGVQSPNATVSVFSQNGSIDVESALSADRLNLVARQGGLTGVGNINADEAFLLSLNDINLLDADVSIGSLAASSLGGSVRVASNGGVALRQLTLSEPLRQLAGITAEQAVINGLFANNQIEVRANGNINVDVDRLVALNAGNPQGNQDAIILDTGYSAANPNRSIVINGLPGSDGVVEFLTQGNGGNVRLLGNVTSPSGRSLSVWAGPNGTVEFAGNIGAANQRFGSLVIGDVNNELQSFRSGGNTILRGDVFVSDRMVVQGTTTIGQRLFGPQTFTIDVAGGTMELFGDVIAGGSGQSLNFLFDLDQQYEVLSEVDDEFAVRVPLRFYGSIGTEADPFQSVRLGGDLNATLASTMAFIDSDLRLDEFGQFGVNSLSNIHTDEVFNIWTNDGLVMGDGQRMLVLGDLNIRSNNASAQNFLSDITVVGTSTVPGFVGGNLRIDGDVLLLTRPQPLAILDRFTVLPSNAADDRVQQAFDLGVDLIATNSIQIFGGVQRIVGRTGNAFLSTQSGGSISVVGSDFAFRTFGGSAGMAEALISAGFPGSPEFRVGPVVAFDLVATGPTNDNLGEALADALPDLEAGDVDVNVGLDARDIDVLQRELGLAVESTPTPSNLAITTGEPRANAPTVAAVTDDAVSNPAPPVIRERVSPEGVRQVVVSIFDAFGTDAVIDTVRFPEFGDRQSRFAAFGDAFQAVYDESPDLAAFRSEVFALADSDEDAATVASMLRGVDELMRDVRALGLTESELETIHSVLADRFLNQAGLSEQFAGDSAFNAAIVRELLGFPAASNGAAATDATVAGDGDRPTVSMRTNRR